MSVYANQTVEERYAILDEWDAHHKPKNLAETERNIRLFTIYLEKRSNGYVSIEIMNEAVENLRNQLDWLRDPAPVQPKRTLAQKLYEAGVAPSHHMSHGDKEAVAKEYDAKWQNLKDASAFRQHRQKLIADREAAQHIAEYLGSGRINWLLTNRKRQEMQAKIQQEIDLWNGRVVTDLRIDS